MVDFSRKNDPKTLRGVYGLVLGMPEGGPKTIIIISDLESLYYKYMTVIFLQFAKLFYEEMKPYLLKTILGLVIIE